MLKTKAIRKIFITTLSLFILLVVYSIPNTINNNVLRTNLEVENTTGLYTNNIYLLNNDNYLVKAKILLDSKNIEDKIKKIISNLTISKSSKFSNDLKAIIPKDTKLLNMSINNKIVTLNFSSEFLNMKVDKEKQIISGLVYSILDLDDIDGVIILVNNKVLDKYPNTKEELPKILDKKIGINKEYNLSSRDNINKVVIYYINKSGNNNYYVPVTKYVNDSRDKIKIIVEELTTSYIYENNLMSFLNSNTKLINYKEQENIMFLNFNKYLFDGNSKVMEEVLYTISYSVFDNYDVNQVMFQVDGKNINTVGRKDLK
ncbi:MAG: GerMN domain-containing protein [Bacilli bacterium]|nr:GerMN domain-containing protein [Bacilli bacterium]